MMTLYVCVNLSSDWAFYIMGDEASADDLCTAVTRLMDCILEFDHVPFKTANVYRLEPLSEDEVVNAAIDALDHMSDLTRQVYLKNDTLYEWWVESKGGEDGIL